MLTVVLILIDPVIAVDCIVNQDCCTIVSGDLSGKVIIWDDIILERRNADKTYANSKIL